MSQEPVPGQGPKLKVRTGRLSVFAIGRAGQGLFNGTSTSPLRRLVHLPEPITWPPWGSNLGSADCSTVGRSPIRAGRSNSTPLDRTMPALSNGVSIVRLTGLDRPPRPFQWGLIGLKSRSLARGRNSKYGLDGYRRLQ